MSRCKYSFIEVQSDLKSTRTWQDINDEIQEKLHSMVQPHSRFYGRSFVTDPDEMDTQHLFGVSQTTFDRVMDECRALRREVLFLINGVLY